MQELSFAAGAAHRSLVSLALNWILHHTTATGLILGASQMRHLSANIAACKRGPAGRGNLGGLRSGLETFAWCDSGIHSMKKYLLLLLGAMLAPAQSVVISQVYGGGGNTGATWRNDFVELFNRGTETVSVAGWTVEYGSATGTTWQASALAGAVEPGRIT